MDSSLQSVFDRPGPFATVLADVSLDQEVGSHAVEVVAQDVGISLREQGAPDSTIDLVQAVLAEPVHEPAPQSRYVIATPDEIVADEVLPIPTPQNVAEWAPLPDLGPKVVHDETSVPFVLVAVDHEGGDVTTYRSHGLQAQDTATTGSDDTYVQKVGAGGLSQPRFHRGTEEVWRGHAREVAELATSRVRDGYRLVIVSGSAESRREVVDALADGPAHVVELDRSARAADGGEEALAEEIKRVLSDHLDEQHRQLDATLVQRLGQGERVAAGVDAVIDALVRGQVDTLAIDLDRARDGEITPSQHPGLDLAPAPPDKSLRSDLALLAGAAKTDTNVFSRDAGQLDGHAAVGLLRWDS